MKKLFFVLTLCLLTSACHADNYNSKNAAAQQSTTDYKVYLEQLKQIGQQYKQVSGQIQGVLKETGIPSFDENTGEIKMVPYTSSTTSKPVSLKDTSISESDSEMVTNVDLPGVDKRSLKISIEQQNILKITGKRKSGEEIERQITLPYAAADKNAGARYEDGVLTVTVRKAESSKPISVQIQ